MSAFPHGEPLLTELDRTRLLKLGHCLPDPLAELLADATAVPSPQIPPHVVTMYSQVVVRHEGGDATHKLVLCYPADAEPARGFVSVLSPIGAALLGQRVGETVEWTAPDGRVRRTTLEALLFQPEASGDYVT